MFRVLLQLADRIGGKLYTNGILKYSQSTTNKMQRFTICLFL